MSRSTLLVCAISMIVFCFSLIAAQNEDFESLVREVIEEEVQPMPVLIKETEERFDDDDMSTSCSATTWLNVRSCASTNCGKVGLLKPNQSVTKRGSSGAWVKVSFSGKTAWAHGNYLRCSNSGGGSSGGGSNKCKKNFPLFKQCDSRWKNQKLGSSSTICRVGCLMSSVSMAMNGLGKKINGHSANPSTLNSYLRSHGGYQGNLFIWSSVSKFGFSYEGKTKSDSTIASRICNSRYVVILNVNGGGHWVLATGVDSNGNYLVNDPGYSRGSYSKGAVVQAAIFRV